jgi:predicted nucleotide-binding protein
VPAPTLQVSVPIGHELLGQCIKQGQALVQRASLVGDFSDYESWKSARKQWIDPTVQALEHMYDGPREARDFVDVVTCPEDPKRWQEQYAADLKCVEQAIDLLTVLQGELAFGGSGPAAGAAELAAGAAELPDAAELAAGAVELPGAAELAAGAVELPGAAELAAGAVELPDAAELAVATNLEPPEQRTAPGVDSFAEPSRNGSGEPRPEVGAELTTAQQVGSQLAHHANGTAPAEREPAGATAPARTRQVLLAHGRDERWKQAVEHLLEQAGEHEIRIVNQRSGGRGRLADALDEEPATTSRYAVVLLTADDVGAPRLESDSEPFFSTRAHQEVVFQMGFLVAALSPGRVCVLYEDGVELPYELDGVSHVRLDLAGTWQPKLLLHLRRAGFDYDMNKLAGV